MKNKITGLLLIVFLLGSGKLWAQSAQTENIKTISTKKAQKISQKERFTG